MSIAQHSYATIKFVSHQLQESFNKLLYETVTNLKGFISVPNLHEGSRFGKQMTTAHTIHVKIWLEQWAKKKPASNDDPTYGHTLLGI